MKKNKTIIIVCMLFFLILIVSTSSLSYSPASDNLNVGKKESFIFKNYPKVPNSEISERDINKILGVDKKALAPEEQKLIENFKNLLIKIMGGAELK